MSVELSAEDFAKFGYVRVAVVVPEHRVADIEFNTNHIIDSLSQVAQKGVQMALFPELCLTAYTCADLFYQSSLRAAAWTALQKIAAASAQYKIATVVGLPVELDGRLYNCAAFLADGRVIGFVPKSYLPNTGEYYEQRWFTSGLELRRASFIMENQSIPIGTDLLFVAENRPELVIGIELCEDLWAVQPPSGNLALAGAHILLNLSASNETLGKAAYRRDLVRQQSARCLAAYLYTSAGPGESTMDTVFSGHALIAENGLLLAENKRLQFNTQVLISDIDLQQLQHERLRNSSYSTAFPSSTPCRRLAFPLHHAPVTQLYRPISPTPFIPSDQIRCTENCQEIVNLQSTGLGKRLRHLDQPPVIIGLSGGLDSTLALLVIVKTFDDLAVDRKNIIAITMPGFGTTDRTLNNTVKLCEQLGITLRTIPIIEAVRQHFQDIDHSESQHDVVYENAQARERTQILMDIANKMHGLVIGTGDLSEAALGWCTFNGDHMSMYHINSGVPKTLVHDVIAWIADHQTSEKVAVVLRDICATPITPELLPLDENQELQQKTESIIGPYELHDFFLYHYVRHGFPSEKILFLAHLAFMPNYHNTELEKWWRVFAHRFHSQQFKRSTMPEGPKVGSIALSPRSDWRMPSDIAVD